VLTRAGICVPPTVIYLPYRVSGSTFTAVGRSQLLARWPGTHCRILSNGIQRAVQTVLGVYLKRTCSRVTSASSALAVLNDYALHKSTHSLTHSLTRPSDHSKTLPANALWRERHIRPIADKRRRRLPAITSVTSAGWQVTLCDPMWHVSCRSGVATLRTTLHLLLTYLLVDLLPAPELRQAGCTSLLSVDGTDRQTDGRTDRRRTDDGQTDGQTDRQTDRRTDRRTDGHPTVTYTPTAYYVGSVSDIYWPIFTVSNDCWTMLT